MRPPGHRPDLRQQDHHELCDDPNTEHDRRRQRNGMNWNASTQTRTRGCSIR